MCGAKTEKKEFGKDEMQRICDVLGGQIRKDIDSEGGEYGVSILVKTAKQSLLLQLIYDGNIQLFIVPGRKNLLSLGKKAAMKLENENLYNFILWGNCKYVYYLPDSHPQHGLLFEDADGRHLHIRSNGYIYIGQFFKIPCYDP